MCDTGLGLEPWRSYAGTTTTGPQGTAQVDVADGNLVVQQVDGAPVQGHGRLGYVLRRTYNSQDSTLLTLRGSLGAGWILNLGEAGDGIGDGIGATALSVPPLTSVTNPLSVTMLDRDGTRHLFQLKTPGLSDVTKALPVLGLGAKPNLGALVPSVLSLATGYSTMCLEAPYQSPAGVHLGLWRYVQVAGSTAAAPCTPGAGAAAPVVAGFASVRPDRFRSEYAADGKLLTQYDGAGNTLTYDYEGGKPAVGIALGRLTGISEKQVCPNGTASVLTPCRRAIRLAYDDANNKVVVTDPAGRVTIYQLDSAANTAQPGRQHLLSVTNADGTAINYTYSGVNYRAADGSATCGQASVGQLCTVSDLRFGTTSFRYGPAPAGAGPPRVSTVTDRRGTPTALDYTDGVTTNATTTTPGSPSRQKIYTKIDPAGRVGELYDASTADSPGGAVLLHATFSTWDRDETRNPDGTIASPAVRCSQPATTRTDNLLCEVVRKNSTGTSPRLRSRSTYNPDGYPIITRRANSPTDTDDPTGSDTTTDGYRATYYLADGTAAVYTDTINGGSQVTSTAPTTGSRNSATALYSVEDHLNVLSPRGNAATPATASACETTDCANWLTSWVVDSPAEATGAANTPPNTTLGSRPCTGPAGSTSNTGLVCSMTGPVYDGANRPVTLYTYDSNGQRATMKTPKAVTEIGTGTDSSYQYTYFPDSASDLSGTVSAGGWLKAVTDPAGAFVAYAYDRAGHTTRTWDRNATAGKAIGQFDGSMNATGDPTGGRYAETLYAPGAPSTALKAVPGRYALSTRDPLGNIVATCVDEHGNALISRPARGTRGAYPDCSAGGLLKTETGPGGRTRVAVDVTKLGPFDTVNGTYTDDDKATSVLTPEEAGRNRQAAQGDRPADPTDHPVTFRYNGYGELTAATDPRGNSKVTSYDAVGRQVNVSWTRGAPNTLPAATQECYFGTLNADGSASTSTGVVSDTDDPLLPRGRVKCSSLSSYNALDQVTATTDAAGSVTLATYDALGRKTAVEQSRTGSVSTKTGWLFDANGNVTDTCPAREYTEGTGRCTPLDPPASRRFSTRTTYDRADQPTLTTGYRERSLTSGQAATATDTGAVLLDTVAQRTRYDADGNPIATAGPNALAPAGNGQLPGTSSSSAQPPLTVPRYESTTTYDLLDRPTASTTPRDATTSYTSRADYNPLGQVTATRRQTSSTSTTYSVTSYDTNNRPLDTVTGASDPDITRTGLYDPATGRDSRSRVYYDADGNTVAVLPPRAFSNSGGSAATSVDKPDLRFLTRTTYDRDGRKLAGYKPRSDNAELSGFGLDSTQSAQCPTGNRPTPVDTGAEDVPATMPAIPDWPAAVGVCSARMSYDLAGNIAVERMATATGQAAGNERYAALGYTDDDLLARIDKPSPTGTGRATTTVRYDGGGRTTATRDPLGNREETVYNLDGTKASAQGTPSQGIDPSTGQPVTYQHVTSWTLDAAGQATATTNGINQTARTSYYADGSTAESGDTGGNTTRYRYDADGQPVEVLSPSGAAKDATNPGGVPTRSTYTRDQLLQTQYDPLTSIAAGATRVRRTDYDYDLAGRKTATAAETINVTPGAPYPAAPTAAEDATRQRFAYDDNDRLVRQAGRGNADPNGGEAITTRYLADGLVDQTRTSGTPVNTGNAGSGSAGSPENTITMNYYADGLLRSTTDGSSAADQATRYEYDAVGMRTARSTASATADVTGGPTTGSTRYAYTDASTLRSVSDTGQITFDYDSAGRVLRRTNPNNTVVTYAHNPDDTLASSTLTGPDPADTTRTTDLAKYAYDYDGLARVFRQTLTGQPARLAGAANQPTITLPAATTEQATKQPGALPTGGYTYRYDTAGRLSSFQAGATMPSTLTHDADGNRTTYGSLRFSYNADDSLSSQSSATDPTAARNYRQTPWGGQASDECTANTYDGFDRLTGSVTGANTNPAGLATTGLVTVACAAGTNTSTFTYDALDRQTGHSSTKATSRVPAGANTRVHYDADGQSLASEDIAGAAPQTLRYLLDDTGGALALSTTTGAATQPLEQLTTDGVGNITTSTSSAGGLSCTARFDPYGSPVNTITTDSTCNTGDTGNEIWFHGGRRDGSTGSYQFGSRTYQPGNANWLTPDSDRTGGSGSNQALAVDPLTRNSYAYVNGDPVNSTDLSGHMTDDPRNTTAWRGQRTTNTVNTCDAACKKVQAEQRAQAELDAAQAKQARLRADRDRLEATANKDCGWSVGKCRATQLAAKAELFRLDHDLMDLVHTALDLASFLPPPAGTVAAVAQAATYLAEGNATQAALAATALVPGGKLLGKAGELARGGEKFVEHADEAVDAVHLVQKGERAAGTAAKAEAEVAHAGKMGKAAEAGTAKTEKAVTSAKEQARSADGKFARKDGTEGRPGSVAEDKVHADLVSRHGAENVRREVTVRAEKGGQGRRFDSVYREDKDGPWVGVEVKSGGARPTSRQASFDSWLNTEGNSAFGVGGNTDIIISRSRNINVP